MIALDVLERVRSLHIEQQRAFWDATLVSACIERGVTRLYSEDLPGRAKIESPEIVSPFA
jgi:predicted nucleic acid-binding protein